MTRRVALTGLGLVTPYGIGVDTLWNGLMEGRSAVRPMERVDLDGMPTTHYGQIPEFDYAEHLAPKETALWSEVSKLTVLSGILAMRDAGLEETPHPTGCILGTGYANTIEFEPLYKTFYEKGWRRGKPVTVPKIMPNSPASHLAIRFNARGINFTVSTACSSGAIAAGLAAEKIRSGEIDACLTGGVDNVINKSIAGAWNSLRVLSRRNDPTASRPFAADRDGLVLAEGSAVLVLEELEAAKARGARIYAELCGVGATNDAVNIVGPDKDGQVDAIRFALKDAAITPDKVGYVNAHGTSTAANDSTETAAIKEVLGDHARNVPVSSIKGHLGHPMGAAGAIEIATTGLSLMHQRVAPTLHWTPGDEQCDLDYVPEGPRDVKMEYALTNSFGFGGQNSVLVLRKV
jgi:3-oxoacyl-[acyl-carrier-protein] synthase II